ncbi:MAG: methylated-DNA--[protein]-cysteine S-methyltransferase, partial [Chloroflexi bacterium]
AALRAKRLKDALRPPGVDDHERPTVTGAAYAAGYGSSSRVYEAASGALGMSPGEYRKGGDGMEIRYTMIETALGCLLLAATERGICAVQFGESPAALQGSLEAEFPRARCTRDDEGLAGWAAALRSSLAGAPDGTGLPLDVQGTAFQQRVWSELRAIPRGQTRTYTQIAEAIGQPSAARAVARACATNPAALVIPCHRVVRAGGALAGYRWGIERKRALLEKEQ